MITKFKLFEKTLQDMPFYSGESSTKKTESDFKYNVNDIVRFKELNRHYIIKHLNKMSSNQDYYIINPLNTKDCGYVLEEELDYPDINSDNYNDIMLKINTDKYNL